MTDTAEAVDPTLLDLLERAQGHLKDAEARRAAAEGAVQFVSAEIARRYALQPGDGVGDDGRVVRAAECVPPVDTPAP